jgi:hypothetical protein
MNIDKKDKYEIQEDIDDKLDDKLDDNFSDILEEDIDDDLEVEINDILIEEDDDKEISKLSYNNFDIFYKFNTNKHKQDGKHALDRDTILKGKLNKVVDENTEKKQDEFEKTIIKYEIGSSYEFESKYNEDYLNLKNLSQDVYEILLEETDIDFNANRRKPNKDKFNLYFNLLYKHLGFKYHKYEIFVELSLYFTDNIFNTFKLLDKDTISTIIKEMMKKGYFQNLENIKFI